jgi:transposase
MHHPKHRKGQRYSADFKQGLIAQCRQPGSSIGAVARAHGLRYNLVHAWVWRAAPSGAASVPAARGFVALPVPGLLSGAASHSELFIASGDKSLQIRWPAAVAADVAAFVKALLT